MKRIFGFALFFLVVLLLVSFVNAFGIAVSYWEPDNPLRIEPGDSADISFRLQNAAEEDEDITLKAEIVEGSEIATITDESTEYFVPAGSEGVKTNIRVSIPEGTPLGTKYKIAIGYTQIVVDEGKMVQIAARIVQNIPVVVGEETVVIEEPKMAPKKGISTSVLIVIGVLIIIVILYYLLKKKKRTRR